SVWRVGNPGTNASLRAVTWGNGVFVAVGDDGKVLTSVDGNAWQTRTLSPATLYGVAYGNGLFVAVGVRDSAPYGLIASSSDGMNWNSLFVDGGFGFTTVAWGGGRFLAVRDCGPTLTSTDGVSWATHEMPYCYTTGVAYGAGTFVWFGESHG